MLLVINEWIFHDLLGENGSANFRETAILVAKLTHSADTIVEPNEERWRRKALQLETVTLPVQREACQLFLGLFYDSARTIRLRLGDIPAVPEGSYYWVPSEDVYLIESYVASGADLLVTTDETLFDAVREHGSVECQMRDDFLLGYGSNR